MYLKDMDDTTIVTTLHYLVDKLSLFQHEEFTDTFMTRLKKEMKSLVEKAKRDHDLDRIIPTKSFQTRMEQRVKRKNLGDDHWANMER